MLHIFDVTIVEMGESPDVVASVKLVAKDPGDAVEKAQKHLAKADPPLIQEDSKYHAQVMHLGPLPGQGPQVIVPNQQIPQALLTGVKKA